MLASPAPGRVPPAGCGSSRSGRPPAPRRRTARRCGRYLVEDAPGRQHPHDGRLARAGGHLAGVARKAAIALARCLSWPQFLAGNVEPWRKSARASLRKMMVSAASSWAKNSRCSRPSRRQYASSSSVVRGAPGYALLAPRLHPLADEVDQLQLDGVPASLPSLSGLALGRGSSTWPAGGPAGLAAPRLPRCPSTPALRRAS